MSVLKGNRKTKKKGVYNVKKTFEKDDTLFGRNIHAFTCDFLNDYAKYFSHTTRYR